ncbi:hypothetical protein [Marinobacterium aestuariivivens]|uniref:Uncharacterized protein n=1 Tax=Marinobacterium aestuariivivens TaxID=1698799 RepID=A0ABW2A9F6_9GAMM
MAKNIDFFFGEYYSEEGASIPLRKMENLSDKVEPAFFTRQLNRFLAEHDGHLRVSDGTSHPPFWKFIDSIQPSSVGYIEIYARTDINNNVDATLACDIVLDNGIVSVVPHWCAYKDIRADEIVKTLLVPLYLKGLNVRTYLRWDDGKTETLSSGMDWGYEEALKAVFKLSKYPSAGVPMFDDDRRRFRYNIRELKLANEVGKENLSGEAAWESLRKRREASAEAG